MVVCHGLEDIGKDISFAFVAAPVARKISIPQFGKPTHVHTCVPLHNINIINQALLSAGHTWLLFHQHMVVLEPKLHLQGQ